MSTINEWKTYDYITGESFQYLIISNSNGILNETVKFLLKSNEIHHKGVHIISLINTSHNKLTEIINNIDLPNTSLIIINIPQTKTTPIIPLDSTYINKLKHIICICNNHENIPIEYLSNNKSKLFFCHLFECNTTQKRDLNITKLKQFINTNNNNFLLSPLNAFKTKTIDIHYILSQAFKYFNIFQPDIAEYKWLISNNQNTKHHKYNIYIIQIILNNSPIHVLKNNLVLKLIQIFNKLENKLTYKYLRGYILTANTTQRKLENKTPIFCAGLDVSLFRGNVSLLFRLKYFRNLRQLSYIFHTLKRPIICGVNGNCIAGGVELAIKCDYRIMFKTCYMQYNEAKNKIAFNSFPDTLNRVINNEDNLAFIFQTSARFYGIDAKNIGFVNEIIDTQNNKVLIDKCLDILENKYLPFSDAATAAQIRSVLRKKYIDLTKFDVEQQNKKIQIEMKRMENKNAKKSKL
eukprot:439348_1